MRQNTQIEAKIDNMRATQRQQPTINNYYNNWVIVGNDVLKEMIAKMGKEKALNFLTAGNTRADIAKVLYFDDILPEQYPIACRDNLHFRFLNDKREIVDDRGGDKITTAITTNMHDAMILAVNAKINDQINGVSNTSHDDLSELQQRLLSMDDRKKMSYNPDHPFFLLNS